MDKELLDYFKGDDLAANVWLSKYAQDGEVSPNQMHERMAKEFARIEDKYVKKEGFNYGLNLSKYGQDRERLTYESIYKLFKDFKYIVPQGSVMSTLGTKQIASISNCWVAESPLDSYAGIHKTDGDLIYYYKRRGGVGIDISNLRPANTSTNNTAKSSTGAISFMSRFSNTTREVAMNGRRGALMLSIDVNHPDVMEFIKIKRDLTKVTGANISIRINNSFMKAVENDKDYILRFPCNLSEDIMPSLESLEYNKITKINFIKFEGYIKKIKTREYWDEMVKSAKDYAEPGLMYWDNMLDNDPCSVYEEYKPISSNPCVTGNTEILTKDGYKEIYTLVDKEVEIWNGFEWSIVTPKVTGYNQHMLKVTLSDGRELTSTDYHKWVLAEGYTNKFKKVETKDLKIGDKIIKYNFPIIKEGEQVSFKHAYTQGFISAEGMDDYKYFWLYEPKYMCKDRLDIRIEGAEFANINEVKRKTIYYNDVYKEKSYVPFEWSLTSKMEWLSGLFDGDGTELIEGGLQICSTDLTFLKDLQKLLSTLSVNCKVVNAQEEGNRMLPDGKGNLKEYFCQKSYRLCIGAVQMQDLKELGLQCSRMFFDKTPQRDASQFVKIIKIEDAGYEDKVYCFNEPLKHFGIFNGILTGQCGEQFLNANDSCRLMAINLYSFVENNFTKDAKINEIKLYEVCYEALRLGDNLVDLEAEYIDRIIDKIKSDPEPTEIKQQELTLWVKSKEKCLSGRRVGLGITALGDMLASLNLQYGSEESLRVIEKVMRIKMEAELDATIDLSILRGSFKGWDLQKEFPTLDFEKGYGNKFYEFLHNEFLKQSIKMQNYGRRNVNWSTVAPTGSVSILTQTSSGVEPLFMPFYIRRKKINPNEVGVRVDFTDQNGDKWQEFPVLHPKFKEWCQLQPLIRTNLENKETLQYAFEQSPWFNSTANDIDWRKRVEIQAILQKYTTNAISSTINLPNTVTYEEVSNIYLHGWKMGLKGQTVYVDGSRSGVLVSTETKQNNTFEYKDAVKRPKELNCDVHVTTNRGVKWNVIVGLFDNKPYEVFAIPHFTDENKLQLVKIKQARYDLFKDGTTYSEDITSEMNSEQEVITRLISTSLRHGANIKFIVEQLNKSQGDITSFSKAISRILKKYIPEGAESTMKCEDCGSKNVIFEEGCSKCKDCGKSACS